MAPQPPKVAFVLSCGLFHPLVLAVAALDALISLSDDSRSERGQLTPDRGSTTVREHCEPENRIGHSKRVFKCIQRTSKH
jgi:hypothetical protein